MSALSGYSVRRLAGHDRLRIAVELVCWGAWANDSRHGQRGRDGHQQQRESDPEQLLVHLTLLLTYQYGLISY